MANKTIFDTRFSNVPVADTVNRETSLAYALSDKQALAQLASTGCFRDTFYVRGEEQLNTILELAQKVDSDFLAKCAVYARKKGFMKDSPALLLAVLAARSHSEHGTLKEGQSAKLFRKVFPHVIDNGKMLRNLVQMLRSGKIDGIVHNLSANTVVKKCIVNFLNETPSWALFKWSVGTDPSLADVIRMVRPKPTSPEKAALFQYLLSSTKITDEGNRQTRFKGTVIYEHSFEELPEIVRNYELFKEDRSREVPTVDFRMLDSLELTDNQWSDIAANAPWLMTLKNINTFNRHNVFSTQSMVECVSQRLRNKELIEKAMAFPYQLLVAYMETESAPNEIAEALHDAMEIATQNVPSFNKKVFVLLDISGSMKWSITGGQHSGSWSRTGQKQSKVKCVDVASLFAATVLRKNPSAEILPFNSKVLDLRVDPRDTVMTNARKMAELCNGATQVGIAIKKLNECKASGDVILVLSDNESWFDGWRAKSRGTLAQEEWQQFKRRNPSSKLVCLDVVPDISTQIKQRKDVLNIGGFSDQVFDVISSFIQSDSDNHWVETIEGINF